jgi:hypothetical protein
MARAGFNDPIEPMDQANMRANGVRLLDVRRGRHVDFFHHVVGRENRHLPSARNLTVPSFDPRMVCTKCGMIGADSQAELVGAWPFDARDVGALSGRRQRRPTPAWCQSAGRTFRSPIRRPGAASLCEAYSPYQDLEPASSPPSGAISSLPWCVPAFLAIDGIRRQPDVKPTLKPETRDAVARLFDAPVPWSRQHQMLGLAH